MWEGKKNITFVSIRGIVEKCRVGYATPTHLYITYLLFISSSFNSTKYCTLILTALAIVSN